MRLRRKAVESKDAAYAPDRTSAGPLAEAPSPASPATDVIQGAEAVAEYLGLSRRQIYHAVEHGYLPVFRIGGIICARRSTLCRWMEDLERDALRR